MKYDEGFIDRLVNILSKNNVLKKKDVDVLKEEFKKRSDIAFEAFLVEENIAEKDDVLQALQEYYDIPSIDIGGEFLDNHLLTMFPKDVLWRYCFVPYERDGVTLVVVAATPDNPELLDVIGRYVSYDVTMMVGYCNDIKTQIDEYYDKALTEETAEDNLREEHEEEREVEAIKEGTIESD